MAEFGVTPTGFNRKRLDDILTELNDSMRTVFGENLNLTPQSPDGQVNGVISGAYADLWEIAEQAYNGFNPQTATGVYLSNLVLLNGIERLPATASTTTVDITGNDGTVIPQGALIETSDTSAQFATDAEVTISGGVASVGATSVNTGATGALAGTLTVIVNPVTGWDSVTNAADASVGEDEETDSELRIRRTQSLSISSQSILDSIVAGVLALDGVVDCIVTENDTDGTVGGLPPHSFETIVLGGNDNDVAKEIFKRKPIGIATHGNKTRSVEDSTGRSHDIKFSAPGSNRVYVTVNITIDSDFPGDGAAQIIQAIIDYANGDLIQGRGFGVGDDIIHSRLYTPVNTVIGHTIDDIFIGFAQNPTSQLDLTLSDKQYSIFKEFDDGPNPQIVVNVTQNG